MDILINAVLSAPPAACLKVAWDIFAFIWKSIDRVKQSRKQLGCLAWTIAQFMRALDHNAVSPGLLAGTGSPSSTVINEFIGLADLLLSSSCVYGTS